MNVNVASYSCRFSNTKATYYGNNNVYLQQTQGDGSDCGSHDQSQLSDSGSHDQHQLSDRTYEVIPPLTYEQVTKAGQTALTNTATIDTGRQIPKEQKAEEPVQSRVEGEQQSIENNGATNVQNAETPPSQEDHSDEVSQAAPEKKESHDDEHLYHTLEQPS